MCSFIGLRCSKFACRNPKLCSSSFVNFMSQVTWSIFYCVHFVHFVWTRPPLYENICSCNQLNFVVKRAEVWYFIPVGPRLQYIHRRGRTSISKSAFLWELSGQVASGDEGCSKTCIKLKAQPPACLSYCFKTTPSSSYYSDQHNFPKITHVATVPRFSQVSNFMCFYTSMNKSNTFNVGIGLKNVKQKG